jgi:hypothetical protein
MQRLTEPDDVRQLVRLMAGVVQLTNQLLDTVQTMATRIADQNSDQATAWDPPAPYREFV